MGYCSTPGNLFERNFHCWELMHGYVAIRDVEGIATPSNSNVIATYMKLYRLIENNKKRGSE